MRKNGKIGKGYWYMKYVGTMEFENWENPGKSPTPTIKRNHSAGIEIETRHYTCNNHCSIGN